MKFRSLTSATLIGTAVCLSLMLMTTRSEAADWKVQSAGSEITFEYESDGSPRSGVFASFGGSGKFDPDDPANASMELEIETSSIDLYEILLSSFAQSAEWFDSKNHPKVRYRLLNLKPVEGNLYEAEGLLSIRGKELPISSQIDLSIDESEARARGTLEINRSDYLLGVGPSAAFVDIGPVVQVRFDLNAVRSE